MKHDVEAVRRGVDKDKLKIVRYCCCQAVHIFTRLIQRFMVAVLFPHPPFWLVYVTIMVFFIPCAGLLNFCSMQPQQVPRHLQGNK